MQVVLCLLCAELTVDFWLPLISQVHLSINIVIQVCFYNSYAQTSKCDLSMHFLKTALEMNLPWEDIWDRCALPASGVAFEVSLK